MNGSLSAASTSSGLEPWESRFRQERIAHWNRVGRRMDRWRGLGAYYQRCLIHIYRWLIPENQRVLEIGCGQGDLLAALNPREGVGVDFSSVMVERAKRRYPGLRFLEADAHDLSALEGTFDYIILSDLLNDVWDVQKVLEEVRRKCTPRTRIVINSYSRLWEIPLRVASKLGLSKPNLAQNWLTVEDLTNLLHLADFEVIRHFSEILFPLPVPFVATVANRFLVRLWPFRHLALTNFVIARPSGSMVTSNSLVSVIVPARNEAGNIESIFARVPEMGGGTELIFVEGHSKDDTYEVIKEAIAKYPKRQCRLLRQHGSGKGDAVRLGFAHARGDVFMILDADLTVAPEDLPRFFQALLAGKGELINGVRLVYPFPDNAMQRANYLGNKFFSLAFSWLLGQPIKDTLCGTKVMTRVDYDRIAANRDYFGNFDPFGDFDLIFGAAKLGLKITDLPIRYHERTYGTTNIRRWQHGWLLLRMLVFAAVRLRFF